MAEDVKEAGFDSMKQAVLTEFISRTVERSASKGASSLLQEMSWCPQKFHQLKI
jgi:hypothetical protein